MQSVIAHVPNEIVARILMGIEYDAMRRVAGAALLQDTLMQGSYWRGRTLRIRDREGLRRVLSDKNTQCARMIDLTDAEIDDTDLAFVAAHFSTITRITLASNRDLTDAGISDLLARHGAGGLREIRLARLFRLTNVTLENMSRHCSHLRRIDLDGCLYSVSGLAVLLQGTRVAKTLRHLSMSRCHLIDTERLPALLGDLAGIRSLDLSHLDGLQTYQVETIVRVCGRLRRLSVQGCPEFTLKDLAKIQQLSPGLQIVHDARLEDHTIDAVRRFLLGLTNV